MNGEAINRHLAAAARRAEQRGRDKRDADKPCL